MIQQEIWLPVTIEPYSEFYEISSHGRMRRSGATRGYPAGHIMTPKAGAWGYLDYKLTAYGKRLWRHAHQFVALAFLGPRPSQHHCVAHWDGNKHNNHVSNLRWATYSENLGADKRRLGEAPVGDRNGSRKYPERLRRGEDVAISKLTADEVRVIRERYASGAESQQRIADEYGVSQPVVSAIIRRKTWRHVGMQ